LALSFEEKIAFFGTGNDVQLWSGLLSEHSKVLREPKQQEAKRRGMLIASHSRAKLSHAIKIVLQLLGAALLNFFSSMHSP
jgi:hypothetical protein